VGKVSESMPEEPAPEWVVGVGRDQPAVNLAGAAVSGHRLGASAELLEHEADLVVDSPKLAASLEVVGVIADGRFEEVPRLLHRVEGVALVSEYRRQVTDPQGRFDHVGTKAPIVGVFSEEFAVI